MKIARTFLGFVTLLAVVTAGGCGSDANATDAEANAFKSNAKSNVVMPPNAIENSKATSSLGNEAGAVRGPGATPGATPGPGTN